MGCGVRAVPRLWVEAPSTVIHEMRIEVLVELGVGLLGPAEGAVVGRILLEKHGAVAGVEASVAEPGRHLHRDRHNCGLQRRAVGLATPLVLR
tara:strand:+ start:522 stop:800 length:279 start_codon:yes stop_codon:yes gene_type:complete